MVVNVWVHIIHSLISAGALTGFIIIIGYEANKIFNNKNNKKSASSKSSFENIDEI